MKTFIACVFFPLILTLSCKQNNTETVSQTKSNAVKNSKLTHVEPPNWWIGFNNSKLQLLVHDAEISDFTPEINYNGITIEAVHKAKSPNYLFLDLEINKSTKAGAFDIVFKKEGNADKFHTYELKNREKPAQDYVGFDSSDVVYLITPDRFANGKPQNDINLSLNEKTINREDDYARHGGDIKGITAHLDYIDEMGFTAIWSCPLLTNNMHQSSYHGYAMTNFYEVDPRFGTLEEYCELADKAREKNIKIIMDQVANHCGLEHWWMKDLPFNDWINDQENYETHKQNWTRAVGNFSNHRRTANQDLYASKNDKKALSDGWFVPAMPDLNQHNPFMANYITQNSIWWIETLGLAGIRQDTYPYPDKEFMSNWAGTIMNEYPNFSIVGEEWSYNPLLISYWQEGANNKDGYNSNLKSTMDFAMQQLIVDGLSQEEHWDEGLVKIYEGLANDFIYPSPKDIMVFSDNHDMSRIFTQLKGDVANTKMALATILTLPRIPQIYYGTEILMNDFKKPGDHGLIRTDFPGGWQGDTVNAFTGKGLTNDQKEMQMFLKKVLNHRKDSKAIHKGETIHFAPFLGTYFLFRIIEDETVVLILNKNKTPLSIDLKRYAEIGLEGKTLKNIVTEETFVWNNHINLNQNGCLLLTTKL